MVAAIVGGLLGVALASTFWMGSGIPEIGWAALTGVVVGVGSKPEEWAITGGVFGCAVSLSFAGVRYQGGGSSHDRLLWFALVGLGGAVSGLSLSFLGSRLRRWRRDGAA